MKSPIEWSPRTRNDYITIVGYLLEKRGEKVTRNYSQRIEKVLQSISEHPTMYPATGMRKNVKKVCGE